VSKDIAGWELFVMHLIFKLLPFLDIAMLAILLVAGLFIAVIKLSDWFEEN